MRRCIRWDCIGFRVRWMLGGGFGGGREGADGDGDGESEWVGRRREKKGIDCKESKLACMYVCMLYSIK